MGKKYYIIHYTTPYGEIYWGKHYTSNGRRTGPLGLRWVDADYIKKSGLESVVARKITVDGVIWIV